MRPSEWMNGEELGRMMNGLGGYAKDRVCKELLKEESVWAGNEYWWNADPMTRTHRA